MNAHVDTQSPTPTHMENAKGHMVPVEMISERDKLIDQTVRQILNYANPLMSQIARFRGHSFDDINTLMALLSEDFGYVYRGKKGNVSFTSFDGLVKVEIRVQDYITFGPELQIAKGLIDEYIEEIRDGLPAEIQTLLTLAFDADKPGKVNRSALYQLRRWPITHPKWVQAMAALEQSMRVLESKDFFQISVREDRNKSFRVLPINLAHAYEVEE